MKIVEGYEEHGVDEAREGSFTYELGTAAWKLSAMPKIALASSSGLAIPIIQPGSLAGCPF